jgi:hypothetical protein
MTPSGPSSLPSHPSDRAAPYLRSGAAVGRLRMRKLRPLIVDQYLRDIFLANAAAFRPAGSCRSFSARYWFDIMKHTPAFAALHCRIKLDDDRRVTSSSPLVSQHYPRFLFDVPSESGRLQSRAVRPPCTHLTRGRDTSQPVSGCVRLIRSPGSAAPSLSAAPLLHALSLADDLETLRRVGLQLPSCPRRGFIFCSEPPPWPRLSSSLDDLSLAGRFFET